MMYDYQAQIKDPIWTPKDAWWAMKTIQPGKTI